VSELDIRPYVCPMTWVRVKLALEALSAGDTLVVLLRGAEPLRNVPRSAAGEGHLVHAPTALPDGSGDHRLVIEKRR
jgi:tRNA 2-thiouridine synthesizing protein A